MNVLLLPHNIASNISHRVKALKSIGINARGLTFGSNTIITNDGIKILPAPSDNFLENYFNQIKIFSELYRAIKWADILHWLWDFGTIPKNLDKKLIKFFDKPGVIQWCGSDIRNPEIESAINPYYRAVFNTGYEYKFENSENSVRNQRNFAEIGFYPLESTGIAHYIDKNLFPKRFQTTQLVVLSEHKINYPTPDNQKPLILHSPSAPFTKGTKYVLKAIDNLKQKYEFDFLLVQHLKREQALEIMRNCDIYIDQLILGVHGYAAIEAMAFGKPVICYINPVTGKDYPVDLPIINANPDNIKEKLELLIKDPPLRHRLGIKGRNYVEKYHDEKKVAQDLVTTYEEVIRLHKENRGRT